MTPRGIGLIGLGRHGMRYARHLLRDVPRGRLVAVCRRNQEVGERFAADHGVKFVSDPGDLIAMREVEAVVVATPPSAYREICLEAVRQRKPLLVEKPLGPSAATAREIVTAADEAGVPLMVAHTLRFEPAVRALRERRAEAGKLAYLVLTSRLEPRSMPEREAADYGGRGALLEIGIHLLDLARFLTEEDIVEVRCDADRSGAEGPESRAWASLRTTGGVPCLVDVSRVSGGRVGRGEWVGESGQLLASWIQHRLELVRAGTLEDVQVLEGKATLVDVLSGFLDALDEGRPMPVRGLDGLRAVQIADACYESAATGRSIAIEYEC